MIPRLISKLSAWLFFVSFRNKDLKMSFCTTLVLWFDTVTHVSLYQCFTIVDFRTCYLLLQGPFFYIVVKMNIQLHVEFSFNLARISNLKVSKIASVFI